MQPCDCTPLRLETEPDAELRLPVVGRIEAHLIWTVEDRAGFQFERVIRLPDFMALIEQVGTKLR